MDEHVPLEDVRDCIKALEESLGALEQQGEHSLLVRELRAIIDEIQQAVTSQQ